MYNGALSDYNSIEDFHSDLLKRYKKSCKNNDIYYIGYITIKTISDYENIRIVHPLYLVIGEEDGNIEEKNGNKHLTFASTDKNKKALIKCIELWDETKYLTKTINGDGAGGYGKDFMKIKFNSDDNLSLNKILKLHMLTVIVRSVFQENGKYYPHVF